MENDAERLLRGLGVSSPAEIDLTAIAYTLGLRVKYEPLQSCDARLVGFGKFGIVTVRSDQSPERQRFSLGHEVAHWLLHKHQVLMCQPGEIFTDRAAAIGRERTADRFASDLLLPNYLLQPLLTNLQRPTFEAAMKVAGAFGVSVTASVRKLVATNKYPAMVVSYGKNTRRRWVHRAEQVDERWRPKFELDGRSPGLGILFGKRHLTNPVKVGAERHFECSDASMFDVYEQYWSPQDGEVLALLCFARRPT